MANVQADQVPVQTELILIFSQKHFIFTTLYFLYFREEGRNIIFLDETWIDTSYTNKKVWQSDDVPGIYMLFNKGQRLIVIHAGGEMGFVPGAQEIFNPGLASSDYHGQMDGSNFEKWYNKKFLPNLPSNSIIVMDNASYHSVQTDRAPTTASRKTDIQVRSPSNHAMVYYLFSFSILVKMYFRKQCRPIIHLDFVISIGDCTVG